MTEPHVLKFDTGRSGRANTFAAKAVTPHMWKIEAFIRFASAPVIHCAIYIHEKLPEGGRRRDPEGVPAMLVSRLSESDWAIENCRVARNAPMASFILSGWVPSADAA